MKKKLLFVVEAMGGGVFSYIVDLSNELIEKYDVYIAYGVRKQTPSNFKEYFDERVTLIKVENFNRSVSIIRDLKAFFEIKKIKKEVNPDIIHLHSSKAGVLGRVAFAFDNRPVFYTPHGYAFLMTDTNYIKRKIYKIIEKICSLGGATTIACSPGEFKQSLMITKKTKLVENGINTSKMITFEDFKSDELDVVTVGRATYQKNPSLFNAIAKLLPNTRFTWIGDGELANTLNSLNINLTGWLTRDQAMKKMQSSKIFVLTSLWEGLPISLLEAMYLKKVCVVTDVVGNNDVIKNGVNGFICHSPKEFAQTINGIINGDVNIEKITLNARQDILNKYNTKVMARKYTQIYQDSLR